MLYIEREREREREGDIMYNNKYIIYNMNIYII